MRARFVAAIFLYMYAAPREGDTPVGNANLYFRDVARLVMLNECGHFSYLERPGDVRKSMTDFFRGTVAAQPPAVEPLASVALPPALARVLSDYEAAWRAKDAAALARLFADDRVVVPNACPPVRGRHRVQECYAGSGGPLFLRAVAYSIGAPLGYIVGAYRNKEDGPDQGKFTLTLAQAADGRWLIVADMDRSYPRR